MAAKFTIPPTPTYPGVDPEIAGPAIAYWKVAAEQFGRNLETAVQMLRAYPDLVASVADGAPFPEQLVDLMREESGDDWEPFSDVSGIHSSLPTSPRNNSIMPDSRSRRSSLPPLNPTTLLRRKNRTKPSTSAMSSRNSNSDSFTSHRV